VKLKQLKLRLTLHFDATFEAEAEVTAVVMTTMLHLNHLTTALGNQKTLLANHVAEKIVMIPLVNHVTMTKLT